MQLPVPTTSQGWADKILWLVLGLFGGGGVATIVATLLNQLLNRKQQHSQVAKNTADAQHTTLDGLVKSSNQILVLMDRLNRLEGELDENNHKHENGLRFYRTQVEYFEALDLAYRNRSHDLNGELGRLVLGIREIERKYAEDTNKSIEPFPIVTSDEIVKRWPLPTKPESLHDGS